jgi:hypothetical protein
MDKCYIEFSNALEKIGYKLISTGVGSYQVINNRGEPTKFYCANGILQSSGDAIFGGENKGYLQFILEHAEINVWGDSVTVGALSGFVSFYNFDEK